LLDFQEVHPRRLDMAIRSLIPWRQTAPVVTSEQMTSSIEREIDALRREMNRLFQDFWGETRLVPRRSVLQPDLAGFMPAVEVRDADSRIEISAELPGMTEKNIQVTLSPDATTLTLKGEKKLEREEKKGETYYECERSYGSFRREVLLPSAVKPDEVHAVFENGILNVTLEKAEERDGERPIPVEIKGQESGT
jgi:HSP20 family protein